MEDRAEKKIERRRLLFQIEEASPELVVQQSGIHVLPVEIEWLGIEAHSPRKTNQTRNRECSGERGKASASAGHSPLLPRPQGSDIDHRAQRVSFQERGP
jgi:hypothetical protein